MSMRLNCLLDVNQLAKQLSGREILPGVEPWRSQLRALSRAISFLENEPRLATILLQHPDLLTPQASTARVIGLTGLPGAGKSTLTNLLVRHLRAANQSVAVLAVDPSSRLTGGAILGDRVRMHEHFRDSQVFIRSMGSRGTLGGLARAARGVIRLMGFIGFDVVLVETVGIGQSESEIVDIADTTALVLMPNSGDDIQLMKAGILEVADVFVVNKSDLADPSKMVRELNQSLEGVTRESGWTPRITTTSAHTGQGVENLVQTLLEHRDFETTRPRGQAARRQRVTNEIIHNAMIIAESYVRDAVAQLDENTVTQIEMGQLPAMVTAGQIVQTLLGAEKNKLLES